MNKFSRYLFHPSLIKKRFSYKKFHTKKAEMMSDGEFIKKYYKYKTGKELNLDSPKTFNEKLQWLKLYDRNPLFTSLTDKIKVKEIIGKLIGTQYILPTIAVWSNPKDIDFKKLPNSFVLKCNHDSGSAIVCKNKNSLNIKATLKKIAEAYNTNYYLQSREWPYKNIEKKIFAEKYIESEDGSGIVDYKFYCFNGEPKFLYISRGMDHHQTAQMAFFDLNGKKMPFNRLDYNQLDCFDVPSNFEELKKLAKKLAIYSEASFVRVDLYSVSGKIYFSEFTFYPAGGYTPFDPSTADEELGDLLNLKTSAFNKN